MTIDQKPVLFANKPGIFLDQSVKDFPVLVIDNASAEAKIALHGAHLFHWKPIGEDPAIYTSPDAVYRVGKAIRGGIPVCWPWFNAHPADTTLPAHGFARNRFWELTEVNTSPEATRVKLNLEATAETQKIWPYNFTSSVTITVGEVLKVELYTENTGNAPFHAGGALHTYLSVGDVRDITISGLENTDYIDTVGEESRHTQTGEITISGEIDRIFQNTTAPIVLKDHKKNRAITVKRGGSTSAVIWNPWVEKAQSLADLPDAAYRDFVCIEATNARGDVYFLEPGCSHALTTTIQVNPL